MKSASPHLGFASAAMLLALLVLPANLHSAPPSPALHGTTAPAPAPAKGFDAFRLVRLLNIFDPERRAMRSDSSSNYTRPSYTRNSRSRGGDFVALTGTMVTEGRQLAFFTGSQTEFNKVITTHDKIAGYTIAGISSTHVDLQEEGKPPLVLVVGKQLALDGSGIKAYEPPAPLEVSSDTPSATPPSASAENGPDGPGDGGPSTTSPAPSSVPGTRYSPRSASSAAPAAAPESGDKSDLIKRMMERAAKERQ